MRRDGVGPVRERRAPGHRSGRVRLAGAVLVLLFVTSWAAPLVPVTLLSEVPGWLASLGWAGLAALVVLVLRWLLSGALGYESTIGLRIIRAERVPRRARV